MRREILKFPFAYFLSFLSHNVSEEGESMIIFIFGQSRQSVKLIFWDRPFYMTIRCTPLLSVSNGRFPGGVR